MLRPHSQPSKSRVRLRFGAQRRLARPRFGITSLLALTVLAATLVSFIEWLFLSDWPLMPILMLVPPTIAICLLLAATEYEIWKGVLFGALAAIGVFVYRQEHTELLAWRKFQGWNNGVDWPAVQMFYAWIFFKITVLPLVGGCIEAMRRRYMSLGIYSLFAAFIYYFAIVFGVIWIVITQYRRF